MKVRAYNKNVSNGAYINNTRKTKMDFEYMDQLDFDPHVTVNVGNKYDFELDSDGYPVYED